MSVMTKIAVSPGRFGSSERPSTLAQKRLPFFFLASTSKWTMPPERIFASTSGATRRHSRLSAYPIQIGLPSSSPCP